MSNHHGPNHTYLPVIPQPPGVTKYRLANPSYSTQMTPPYGQPNPPPSNHLAFNYEARHDNHDSNEARDKVLYTVFYLCGKSQGVELKPSEHYPRRKYTIQKSLCHNDKYCEHCRTVNHQSENFNTARDKEIFRGFVNDQLLKLWTQKDGLFKGGFANSDNKPPLFDSTQIMSVILKCPNEIGDKINMGEQKNHRRRQQREQQRQRKRTASVASELPLQNSSSQMARTNSFSPDNEQDRSSLMVRSFSEPWSWASGGPERR
ncbi:hypothetical protein BGAL_0132g00010 [Botrytis galanthina]|uniref:Uncharacterized protein n=1 Tax=Botrytis galanthina TaxID=278940 RepID=A0A4S8R0K5_9HELO|nr:hypothetical protein BGAL_0132g00010 [Botrytis galanthina]